MTREVIPIVGDDTALTTTEVEKLKICESRIRTNIKGFVEVGTALAEIKEGRLFRVDHSTFEEYVKDRWQFGRAHAYRLIDAAETARALSPRGDIQNIPATIGEKHLRPLLQFPVESRAAVWERITKCCGDMPTTNDVERTIRNAISTSTEEPYQSVRRSQKRVKRERMEKANEERTRRQGKSSPKPPAFDLAERSQLVAERVEFWLQEWPAEHRHTLAELLRRHADDIVATAKD